VVDGRQAHDTFLTPLAMGWASVQDRLGFRQEVEDFLQVVRSGGEVRTPARMPWRRTGLCTKSW